MASRSHDIPADINPSARYLFYLHGKIAEDKGPNGMNPQFGAYDYFGLLKAFEGYGFTVVSELRSRGTKPGRYARRVARQIEKLKSAGVPSRNIAVVGFSKGGAITFYVSAALDDPELNYVVMAGCGKGSFARAYKQILKNVAPSLSGRFLSIYDRSDDSGGTCKEAFKKGAGSIKSSEMKLKTGLGHGVFYRPRNVWLKPVTEWITRN